MSAVQLIDQVKALPEEERERFYCLLTSDQELAEDLLDNLLIEERRTEPARSLTDILADLQIKT